MTPVEEEYLDSLRDIIWACMPILLMCDEYEDINTMWCGIPKFCDNEDAHQYIMDMETLWFLIFPIMYFTYSGKWECLLLRVRRAKEQHYLEQLRKKQKEDT